MPSSCGSTPSKSTTIIKDGSDGNFYRVSKSGSRTKLCKHLKVKYFCKDCKGKGICIHSRVKYYCIECKGKGICRHRRQKSKCKECNGPCICKHDKIKYFCRECCGSGLCRHYKRKEQCIKCDGNSICKHNRHKYTCTICHCSICKVFTDNGHCDNCIENINFLIMNFKFKFIQCLFQCFISWTIKLCPFTTSS